MRIQNVLSEGVCVWGGGGGGVNQNSVIGPFLSNTGPDPLENNKNTMHDSIQCWAIISPFKWRFAGGPMMARVKWYLDPHSY